MYQCNIGLHLIYHSSVVNVSGLSQFLYLRASESHARTGSDARCDDSRQMQKQLPTNSTHLFVRLLQVPLQVMRRGQVLYLKRPLQKTPCLSGCGPPMLPFIHTKV